MNTLTNDFDTLEDPVDLFCYELAMALRRILGLPAPWDDFEDESLEEDDDVQTA